MGPLDENPQGFLPPLVCILPPQGCTLDGNSITHELHIAQVENSGQQLAEVPVFGVREHEDLHGRADMGIVLGIIAPLTGSTVPLKD